MAGRALLEHLSHWESNSRSDVCWGILQLCWITNESAVREAFPKTAAKTWRLKIKPLTLLMPYTWRKYKINYPHHPGLLYIWGGLGKPFMIVGVHLWFLTMAFVRHVRLMWSWMVVLFIWCFSFISNKSLNTENPSHGQTLVNHDNNVQLTIFFFLNDIKCHCHRSANICKNS